MFETSAENRLIGDLNAAGWLSLFPRRRCAEAYSGLADAYALSGD
jgi:hypothetical protein